MVGAPLHHLGDVLGFLVDGHGADDSSLRGWRHHLDLNGACLRDLAVQLLQFCGILLRDRSRVEEGEKQEETIRIPALTVPFWLPDTTVTYVISGNPVHDSD